MRKLNESKKSIDLILAKCFSKDQLTIQELREIEKLSESDLLVDFDCDLYFVEQIKQHVKSELYRLRAQNQFTPFDTLKKGESLYPQQPYTRTTPLTEIFKKKIIECPDEDMLGIELHTQSIDTYSSVMVEFETFLGMLRAMQLWYQGAHHSVSGESFTSDHKDLFGELYTDTSDEFDAAVEKIVGLTNNVGYSCPVNITRNALDFLQSKLSPPNLNSFVMSSVALQIEKEYIGFVESLFDKLESIGSLSLGLNDFLSATANNHESRIYKLQQRTS